MAQARCVLGSRLRNAAGVLLLLVTAPALGSPDAPAAGIPDASAIRAPVEALYATLLEVMHQADELGFAGRYAKLEPVVKSSYDLEFMASRVVGRQYQRLDPAQQAAWLETFGRLTISTYADRFDSFDGERLEIGDVEEGSGGTSIVRTVIHPAKDDPVELDYRMRAADGGWKIVDVYLSGTVSELALRRSDYSGVLRNDGFEALEKAVEAKIAEAEAGTDADD
jgi:phospholipid transport system substrate-binding protein